MMTGLGLGFGSTRSWDSEELVGRLDVWTDGVASIAAMADEIAEVGIDENLEKI
jgi:hypothetical protein